MLKTYKSKFAGQYEGLRFRNQIFQTSDEEVQSVIEGSKFFQIGEIKLISEMPSVTHTEPVSEDFSIEAMGMPALRKKASELGIKASPKTKKHELIQMIENVI